MEERLPLTSSITDVADMFVNKDYEVSIFKSDFNGTPCIDLLIEPIGVIHYIAGLNGLPQEYVFDGWYGIGKTIHFGEDSRKFLEHVVNLIEKLN
ncbi:hypothetical protein CW685_00435 [Macrococcoides caseolyticum]|uniref:hypothetical protein n=1 Tax=Macrococcoides caseolyticum TaxID=69966 RepID=UPI000C327074|nr:hypothetical protein [Macrococcus caseolyticus]PKE13228.1 hypothetical protein CW685_00435 [Macrococcus caseolyticus]